MTSQTTERFRLAPAAHSVWAMRISQVERALPPGGCGMWATTRRPALANAARLHRGQDDEDTLDGSSPEQLSLP